MYIKVIKIEDVHYYDFESGVYSCIFSGKKGIMFKDKFIDLDRVPYDIRLIDKYIYTIDSSMDLKVWKDGLLIREYSNVIFAKKSKKHLFTIDFNLELLINYTNLFDLETQKKILLKDVPYTLEYSKGIIIGDNESKKKVVRLNKDTSIVWEYDLSKELPKASYDDEEEDYLDKFIDILGTKLWLLTEAGRLVALDVETGKVLKVFSGYEEDAENGFEVMFVDFCKKEGDEDYLYGIGNDFFYKLDVHQLKLVEKYCFIDGTLKEFESIMYPNLQGDYFTFLAEKSDRKFRYAGVYDYINRKTVWIEEIISEKDSKKGNCLISPEPLQMHGDKLYIKDYHQNFHIFEKEQTSV